MWASNPNYVQKTVDCVTFLAKNVGSKIDILEVINEPAGFLGDDFTNVLKQYYTDTYNIIRKTVGNDMGVMISDGFRGLDVSISPEIRFRTPDSTRPTVLERFIHCTPIPRNVNGHRTQPVSPCFWTITDGRLEQHMYQIFSNTELSRTFDQHIQHACTTGQTFVDYQSSSIWLVSGEWSNALTDCAKWLNGRGVGARWEGKWGTASDQHFFASCDGYTGDSSTFSKDYKDQMRKYFEVQVEVGERVQGWVFWTWKVRDSTASP